MKLPVTRRHSRLSTGSASLGTRSDCKHTAHPRLARKMLAPRASIVSVLNSALSVELAAARQQSTLCSMQDGPKGFRLALDDITKLMDAGKEKGYLAYGEMNDLIPHDVHSCEVLEDLLATIGTQGIDVLEGQPKLPSALEKGLENEVEADEVELDPTPGALEKTNDPVRLYLREMGTVPLLTREREVDVAKRIERGRLQVLKALSRSPVVIHQILAISKDLKQGVRSIREIVVFEEEDVTQEILQNRVKDLTRRIDELQKRYKRVGQLAERLLTIPSKRKAPQYSRCRCRAGREIVRISLIIRNLGLTNFELKHLIDRVNKAVEIMGSLDRQISNLEKKITGTHSEELKKDYRKTQRQHRATWKDWKAMPTRASRNCGARNAKSSRARWTRSRPNTNSSKPTSASWFPSPKSIATGDCSSST